MRLVVELIYFQKLGHSYFTHPIIAPSLSLLPNLLNTMHPTPNRRVAEQIPGLVTLYDDGSIERDNPNPPSPCSTVSLSQSYQLGFPSLDLTINPSTNLWARLFAPEDINTAEKAPVVLHFHGGGFCVGSPSWKMYHDYLGKLAVKTGAIWVSVDYRLAPEHRLPAGYHDCLEALEWLQRLSFGAPDLVPWLSTHADYRRFFLAGDSVGGNMAFHVTLHYARVVPKTEEGLRLLGVILLHPGFIKEERSSSETAFSPEVSGVDLGEVDAAARMALPEGENKDYFVLNPSALPAEEVKKILPPFVVAIGGKDLFRDRQVDFCESMVGNGQRVDVLMYEELGHCFALNQGSESSPEAVDLVEKIVGFMGKCAQEQEQ